MCRNIKPLFNFEPPATDIEIYDAALQFVRKVGGSTKPSKANQEAFDHAVTTIANAVHDLLDQMETSAPPRNREEVAARAREKSLQRFGDRAARDADKAFTGADDAFKTSANRDALKSQEKNEGPEFIVLDQQKKGPAYSEAQVKRLLGRQ